MLGALTGQALTGMASYNEQALDMGLPELGIGAYVSSSEFAVDVAENWQSEYLQFFLHIVLTVWLVTALVFILSWTAQFIAGRSSYNAEQLMDLQAPLSWSQYLATGIQD